MDQEDGLETGSPYLHLHSPDLARESALLQLSFSEEIDIVFFYTEWLACC